MRRIRLLVPAAAAALIAAPVAAQVPTALAEALMAPMYPGEGGLPDLMVGQLPPEVGSLFALPPGAHVLGSAVYPNAVRGVLATSGASPELIRVLVEQLQRTGWRSAPEPERGGFRPTAATDGRALCQDGRSILLLPSPVREPGGRVTLFYSSDARFEMCREAPAHASTQPPLPTLNVPTGAVVWNSGAGGGDSQADAHADIQSDLSVRELLEHFATQLRERGWQGVEAAGSGDLAAQTWRRAEGSGPDWHGLMVITAVQPGRRMALFRMVRPRPLQ